MALACPRPGCTGEVVNGNCQVCGIAVAEEEGTGWFASPDILNAEESPRSRGARRTAGEPAAQPPTVEVAPVAPPGGHPTHSQPSHPQGHPSQGHPNHAQGGAGTGQPGVAQPSHAQRQSGPGQPSHYQGQPSHVQGQPGPAQPRPGVPPQQGPATGSQPSHAPGQQGQSQWSPSAPGTVNRLLAEQPAGASRPAGAGMAECATERLAAQREAADRPAHRPSTRARAARPALAGTTQPAPILATPRLGAAPSAVPAGVLATSRCPSRLCPTTPAHRRAPRATPAGSARPSPGCSGPQASPCPTSLLGNPG